MMGGGGGGGAGGGMPIGDFITWGRQATADTAGVIDALFGKHDETRAKRRALNANWWNYVRNRGDLDAWGTQSALDVKKGVTDSNANAASYVRNRGMAGSTITPTLQAANARRGTDQLARLGEQIRLQSVANRNSYQSGFNQLIQTPGTPNVWKKIAGVFNTPMGGGGPSLANATGGGGGGAQGVNWGAFMNALQSGGSPAGGTSGESSFNRYTEGFLTGGETEEASFYNGGAGGQYAAASYNPSSAQRATGYYGAKPVEA